MGFLGLSAMLVLNLILMRRALLPLARLSALMRRVDPLRPGSRIAVAPQAPEEVVELSHAFNDMLGRLEDERRDSARRALAAQEDERRRLSRELHDEIGQSLTALLLQLEYAVKQAPDKLRPELGQAREEARASLEEVRRVAQRLRPQALDDLGLRSAITNLCERVAGHNSFRISRDIATDLPVLSPEAELVLYRVAQESLTNAARHSGADHLELRLLPDGEGVVLSVEDDGVGLDGEPAGAGITGMRERALLIGGDLTIAGGPTGGTCVRLTVPGLNPA